MKPSVPATYRATLAAAKEGNVPELIMRCGRLLNELGIRRVRERTGLEALRPAHTALLPHIDLEGTRTTELARRLGVSKQAVSQLVSELEEMGTVERTPDPGDGRAHLVRFTRRGQEGILQGLGLLREIESELADEIGETRMRSLGRTLKVLLRELERH